MKLMPHVNLTVTCYFIELSSDFATRGNIEKSLCHLDGAWTSANEIRPLIACKMAHVFNNNELLTTAEGPNWHWKDRNWFKNEHV